MKKNIFLIIIAVAFPAVMQGLDQVFYVSFASRVMIYAIAATSLNLVLGYGGMISFGHAAFFGLGAYAAALLSLAGWSPWAAVGAGGRSHLYWLISPLILISAPRALKPSRNKSIGRSPAPIMQPPGWGNLTSPKRASKGATNMIEARNFLASSGFNSNFLIFLASMTQELGLIRLT